MVMNLFWTEKVARRILPTLISLFICFSALSQSAPRTQGITLTERESGFHLVIEKLSKMTGLHFIYSSNKVAVNKKVSVTVFNKPLDHILSLLGNQTNVSFTRKDDYVIIKPISGNSQPKNNPNAFLANTPLKIEKFNQVIPQNNFLGNAAPEQRLRQ